jgi:hypothetical protein
MMETPHILPMSHRSKANERTARPAQPERAVIYRGIKIAPISGRRSALARAIRDSLRDKSEEARAPSRQT